MAAQSTTNGTEDGHSHGHSQARERASESARASSGGGPIRLATDETMTGAEPIFQSVGGGQIIGMRSSAPVERPYAASASSSSPSSPSSPSPSSPSSSEARLTSPSSS